MMLVRERIQHNGSNRAHTSIFQLGVMQSLPRKLLNPPYLWKWEMKNYKYNTILTGIQLSYSFQNNLIFKLNRRAYCEYGITWTISRRISLRTSMALLICAHVCLSKEPSISVGGTISWVRTETRSDVGGESWSRRPPSTSSWSGK